MLALKITGLIVLGIIALAIIVKGLQFKYGRRIIFKSDLFKEDKKYAVYNDFKKHARFAWLCSWLINIGLIYLVTSLIILIIK